MYTHKHINIYTHMDKVPIANTSHDVLSRSYINKLGTKEWNHI